MDLSHVNIVFEIIVLLFAVSLHESAHAWTAWRLGDPTAYMLGRITMNPVKHIDLLGSIIVPVITGLLGFPFGWAKPTPINTRNFKRVMRDDILTSVAGPVSNFLLAVAAVMVLKIIAFSSMAGMTAVGDAVWFVFSPHSFAGFQTDSNLNPIAVLLCDALYVNVILTIFNLIPIPPLDGSHVLRHMLPSGAVQLYDRLGMIGIVLVFFFASRVLGIFANPILSFFIDILRY